MDESILFFSRVFIFLKILSRSFLNFVGCKGVYNRVCKEYKKSFFYKRKGSGDSLATRTSREF